MAHICRPDSQATVVPCCQEQEFDIGQHGRVRHRCTRNVDIGRRQEHERTRRTLRPVRSKTTNLVLRIELVLNNLRQLRELELLQRVRVVPDSMEHSLAGTLHSDELASEQILQS